MTTGTTVGPVELIVIAFPGSRFDGRILPELARLLSSGTIAVIDGLLLTKDDHGATTFVEIDDTGADVQVQELAALVHRFDVLISDEDVTELAADIDPGSSAAVLVFEHTWLRPLREAVADAGGIVTADVRVPPDVVAHVLASLDTGPDGRTSR